MDESIDKTFKTGSTTYFYSSIFFPEEIRNDVFVLYNFVRRADNFVDMGGDSLSAVALLEDSCEKFGVEIDLDVFLSAETLDAILAALRAELPAK